MYLHMEGNSTEVKFGTDTGDVWRQRGDILGIHAAFLSWRQEASR